MLPFSMKINAVLVTLGVFTYSLWLMAILTMLEVVFILTLSFHSDDLKKNFFPLLDICFIHFLILLANSCLVCSRNHGVKRHHKLGPCRLSFEPW